MDAHAYSGSVLRWLTATLLAIVATMLLVWVKADSTIAGMAFLVLVVWLATVAGIGLSLCIAVLCALSFDYFFLLPYHTLQLAGTHEWVAMVSFVAGCLVVGRVAEKARRQAHKAEQRRKDVERLYELGQEMMLCEDSEKLIRDLPRLIDRIFTLDGAVLYVCDRDKFYSSTSDLPMSIEASLQAMTQGPNLTLDLPGEFTATVLMLGLRPGARVDQRPYSFYWAVRNFRDYFKTFVNMGIYLEIYFAYIRKDETIPVFEKGIDDLLAGTLRDAENDLFNDIKTAINEKDGQGNIFRLTRSPRYRI